jgi:hypothetical protein
VISKCTACGSLFERPTTQHRNLCTKCNNAYNSARYKRRMLDPKYVLKQRARYKVRREKDKLLGKSNIHYRHRAYINHKKWEENNRGKIRAYNYLHRVIKSGKMVKEPCRVCGSPFVQMHHEDYSKPLNVMFLCTKHHHELHVRKREAELLATQSKAG